MRIKKTSETRPLTGSILNVANNTDTNTYSCEYQNKAFGGKIVWTNQNPTSSFTSTEINLSANDGDCFEIIYATKISETNETSTTGKIPFGKRVRLFYGFTSTNGIGIGQRVVLTSTNSKLTLESANRQFTSGTITTDNTVCVPLYVIVYKTGLFN